MDDGKYRVSIWPGDGKKWHRAERVLELPRDRGRELRFDLHRKVSVSVTVVDENGNPVDQ